MDKFGGNKQHGKTEVGEEKGVAGNFNVDHIIERLLDGIP